MTIALTVAIENIINDLNRDLNYNNILNAVIARRLSDLIRLLKELHNFS